MEDNDPPLVYTGVERKSTRLGNLLATLEDPVHVARVPLEELYLSPEFQAALDKAAPGWRSTWRTYSGIYDPNGVSTYVGGVKKLFETLLLDVRRTKEGDLICPVIFSGTRRRQNEFQSAQVMLFDIDQGVAGGMAQPEAFVQALPGTLVLLYSSFNDGRPKTRWSEDGALVESPAQPRFRAIVFLNRPIAVGPGVTVERAVADWKLIWGYIARRAAEHGVLIDPATKNASRLSYTIRMNPTPVAYGDRPPAWAAIRPGAPLDLDNLPGGESLASLRAQHEAEEGKKRGRVEWTPHVPLSAPVGQSPAFRRARAGAGRILKENVGKLARAEAGEGRPALLFTCGAYLGHLAHLFDDDEVEAWRDAIRDAAEQSGLVGDIDRQLENGFETGRAEPWYPDLEPMGPYLDRCP